MHEAWGLSAEEVIASRQAEEAAAAAVLGAQTRASCRFAMPSTAGTITSRTTICSASPAAAGGVAARRDRRVARISPARPMPGTRIYAPLGVGKHVDHQLVYQAAHELASTRLGRLVLRGHPVRAETGRRWMRVSPRLRGNTALEPVARIPARAGWEQKLDAILRYPSQLETVFRQYVGVGTSREEISDGPRAYAARVGDGNLAERFWRSERIASPPARELTCGRPLR